MRDTPLMQALARHALGLSGEELPDLHDDLEDEQVMQVLMEASEEVQTADAYTHYRTADGVARALDKAGFRVVRA